MTLKKNVLTLSAMALLASCGSSDNSSNVSGSQASTTGGTVSSSNAFSTTINELRADINTFRALVINESAQSSVGLSWWNEASQWKLRDPRLVCSQEDVSACDLSEISAKEFLGIEQDVSKHDTYRNYEESLGMLCTLGEVVAKNQTEDKFIKQGTYEIRVDADKASRIEKACGYSIPANSVIAIDASEDVKDVALYDKKLTATISLDENVIRETSLALRDNETHAYLAATVVNFDKDYSTKTVIWNNKELTFYRAESYKVPNKFYGTPAVNEKVEVTRLYKNGNGLAIMFDSQDSQHEKHGREVVTYALKGNLIYPELATELNIVVNNYKQLTDNAMACYDKMNETLSYCDVNRSIQFWNSLEQVRAIYGNFNLDTIRSNEYTTLQFVNDDEVVTNPLSL